MRFPVLCVLLSSVATPALAEQPAQGPPDGPGEGPAQGPAEPAADGREIVVSAPRIIAPALRDVPVERSYDPDAVASYALSTIGEVLDEIAAENGDDEPSLLVNGEVVSGSEDIEDYPAEAIARIEVLPRGAAARVGGAAGQRAYNVVLRASVATATATASHRFATEGGWNAEQGELLLTWIRGQDRANATLRTRDSGLLRESERAVIQPALTPAYDPLGNVFAAPFGAAEIDPALSALAGRPVTVAGVPVGVRNPALADFARTAGIVNTGELGPYRSLRSANRGYEAALNGSLRLLPWLTATLNGRLDWNRDRGLSGLPQALFVLPGSNPASPFSRDVLLAVSDPARPLRSSSQFDNGNATLMLGGRLGEWSPRLTARVLRQERTYVYERSAQAGAPLALGPAQDPFAAGLAGLIPVTADLTRTRTRTEGLRADIDGPLFKLPAGAVVLHAGAGLDRTRLRATRSSGATSRFARSGTTLQAGLTVPLTNAREGVLPALGDLELSAGVERIDFANQRPLLDWNTELSWQLRPGLRFNAGFERQRTPPQVEQLSAPVVTYPNARVFDPVRGETVDVTSVSGGNPALRAETVDVFRLAVGAAPLPKYNLQLQAEFTATRSRDGIGGLPPASAAVMAAFPARFPRDAGGRLVRIDTRAVNFARQDQDQVRYGASFTVPLYSGANGEGAVTARPAAGPRPRLEFSFSHAVLLSNRLLIAPGLGTIDLLREGATGLGGSRPRHLLDGSATLSDRGTGVRLGASWRSNSSIFAGTAVDPQAIRFGALAIFDLRAFADTARLFPERSWAKGGRLTLAVQNLANTRQRVTDGAGLTPLSYQPAYREAVGRTVSLEFRKAF